MQMVLQNEFQSIKALAEFELNIQTKSGSCLYTPVGGGAVNKQMLNYFRHQNWNLQKW